MRVHPKIDYSPLLQALQQHPQLAMQRWGQQLPSQIAETLNQQRYGDLDGWLQALADLPLLPCDHIELQQEVALSATAGITPEQQQATEKALRALIPWRKGPFHIHGIHIDTEWRSDWKWDRIQPHLQDLQGRLVLDVGCGNGYHCWRMYGAGASRVIGIDPSPRFVVQFHMLKQYLPEAPVDLLPVGIEELPEQLRAFDTTFSMGVFYHRRSPMDHLRELKATLRAGGQLVLETLVIDGGDGEVLVPEGRYAQMNNVWFLPSCETLLGWMRKCGFSNPRVVDVTPTSVEEQRSTDWMTFHSLPQFLDPGDPSRTVEGHPAPLRAVFIAESP